MTDTIHTIATTTRTGKKVHRITVGSSVTHCGVWLRRADGAYAVDAPVNCLSCLGSEYRPGVTFTDTAAAVAEPTGDIIIDAADARPGDIIAGRTIHHVEDLGDGMVLLATNEWGGGWRKPKSAAITVERRGA